MAPEQFARFTTRRPLHFTGLIVVVGAFLLVLAGPRVWARGQINLFGLELARVWTEDTLRPTQNACLSDTNTDLVERMQVRVLQADRYDSKSALHKGDLACLQGDLQLAEAMWSTGVDGQTVDPTMLLFHAVAAFGDGRMIQTSFEDGIGEYGYKRCVHSDREGDSLTAISWCEFSLAFAPNEKTADRLAAIYMKAGDETSAEQVWHRLQEVVGAESPDYWWALGQAGEQEKDWLAAEDAYRRGAALADEKDAFRYYLSAGLMGLRAQDYAAAESAYQLALTLQPQKVDAYLGLGDVYRAQKQYDQAILWYEKAQEMNLKHESPSYYLGLVSWERGDYNDAIAYFDRSLELRVDNPGVLYYKAVTLDALNQRETAAETLVTAIVGQKNPPEHWLELQARWQMYPIYAEDPERWRETAHTAEMEQRWLDAVGLYAEAASRAVGEDAYPYLLREGAMRLRIQDYERSEEAYRQALKLDPGKMDAYLGIGESFRYRKDDTSAETWYREAVAVDPGNDRPPYHLGIVLYNQKRYTEALEVLDLSLSLRPDNPWSLYFRALTLDVLDQPEKAIETLVQAIAAHQNPPESWITLLAQWRGE